LKRRREVKVIRWPRVDEARWSPYVEGSKLAALPMVDVRPRDVRAFVDGLLSRPGKPLDANTITRIIALVRKALGDAAADERIASNPARGTKAPKRADVKEDPWTFLTVDDVRAVENHPRRALP